MIEIDGGEYTLGALPKMKFFTHVYRALSKSGKSSLMLSKFNQLEREYDKTKIDLESTRKDYIFFYFLFKSKKEKCYLVLYTFNQLERERDKSKTNIGHVAP